MFSFSKLVLRTIIRTCHWVSALSRCKANSPVDKISHVHYGQEINQNYIVEMYPVGGEGGGMDILIWNYPN